MVSRQFRVLETVGSSPAASTKLSSVLLGSIFLLAQYTKLGTSFGQRTRPPPVAEAGRVTLAQRSKFCEAISEYKNFGHRKRRRSRGDRGFESRRFDQKPKFNLLVGLRFSYLRRDSKPERAQPVKKNSSGNCFLGVWCARRVPNAKRWVAKQCKFAKQRCVPPLRPKIRRLCRRIFYSSR